MKFFILGVLAELPDRLTLRKTISRTRLKNLPSNPQTMDDLQRIPTDFRSTLSGDNFLLYDTYEDEDYENEFGRIIIFATNENLRNLFRSRIWFVDGTFSCAPSIFFQVFAILAAVSQPAARGQVQTIGLPFVYALMETKQEGAYRIVFQIIIQRAREINLEIAMPAIIMSDFELAIINAARHLIGVESVRCCFFHLGQSIYRQVQSRGLQIAYSNPDDRTIRDYVHMIIALAFVPVESVEQCFLQIQNEIPADLLPVSQYFDETYVRGIPARGRRRRLPPRYSPTLWNQYNSVLSQTARTNNISEGYHNRLQVVIGKNHPSLYAFLVELKKEQSDSEIMIRQIQVGQKVKKGQDPKRKKREEQIFQIVSRYQEYVDNNDVLTYLRSLGHNINL